MGSTIIATDVTNTPVQAKILTETHNINDNQQAKLTCDNKTGTLTINAGIIPVTNDNANEGMILPENCKKDEVKTIIIEPGTKTPVNSTSLFSSFKNLENFSGLNNLDTSQTTSFKMMFYGDEALKSLDVSNWDTSKVTNMNYTFGDLQNFDGHLDLSDWNTSNVTSMDSMFADTNFKELNLSGKFDTRAMLQNDYHSSVFANFYGNPKIDKLILSPNTIFDKKTNIEQVASSWYQDGEQNEAANLADGNSHPGTWYVNFKATPITPATPIDPTPQPTPPSNGTDGVKKHSKVYALHAINMYRNSNLTGKIRHYKKVRRVKRPRFYVKKIVRTKRGTPRYYVKQLNQHRYGWITGNIKFVQNNYYQPRKRRVRFQIINPKGLREYRHLNLTYSKGHLRYGQKLTAKRIIKDGLQTRIQLRNGHYVSARKNFVLYQ